MKKLRKATSTKSIDFLNNPKKSVRSDYTSKFMALARYISKFVERPDFKQNEIAENLEMHESQVSVWLSGFHNFTIKSLLKLESACDIQILNPAIWEANLKVEDDKEYVATDMTDFLENLPQELKLTDASGGSQKLTAINGHVPVKPLKAA
jgi:predicted XRE-type DNA-binding protein